MRKWYASKDMDARRRWISLRDPEAVKAAERRRYEKRKDSTIHKCNLATNQAIGRGDLVRQPCEVCGTTTRIHAHHEDHTKPLEVRWLCAEHHHALHMFRHLGLTGGNV